jgi:hypothetical protein
LRRDKLLQEKEETAELAKQQVAKEKSVECVFWKQQQALRKSDKVDTKVNEFCQLNATPEQETTQTTATTPEQNPS